MPEVNEEKFIETVSLMEDLVRDLGLTIKMVQEARELLKELCENPDFTKYAYDFLGIGALYYQIKTEPSYPGIPLKSFARHTPHTKDKIYQLYSKIGEIKKAKPLGRNIRLAKFVRMFGKKGGFFQETIDFSLGLTKEVSDKNALIGRNPISIVAACFSIAIPLFGEVRSQDEISELFGIATQTLRKTLKNPFFEEKINKFRIDFKIFKSSVPKGNLTQLLWKMLVKANMKDMPFPEVRPMLRRTYPVALRTYTIPTTRLRTVLKELGAKGLIFFIEESEEPKKRDDYPPSKKSTYPNLVIYLKNTATPDAKDD